MSLTLRSALVLGFGAALGLTLSLGANAAGVVFIIASLHLLRINTTLLPVPLRPPMWRRVTLVATAAFYGVFVTLWLTHL